MLSGRKNLDGESQWTRIEYRVKTWIYNMMHELVQAQVINSLIYKLLIVVETLQLIWFAIHPHFDFLWTTDTVTWFRDFLKYLQFDGFLTDSNYSSNVFIGILYVVFAVQILASIIIACHMKFSSSKKLPSTLMAYSTKALSGYMILLNTIFALPFYNVFLAAFICTADDPIHQGVSCYQNTYFIHFVAALIGTILMMPTTVLSAVLCIDLNPWSPTPFAAPKSRLSLFKLLIKVFVPLYFIIDYTGSTGKEFVIIYAVIWLFMLVMRYRQTPFYSKSVFNLTLTMEMILFWTSLVSVFHAFIDNYPIDNIGFLFLWVGAPFIAFTFAAVVNKRRKTYRNVLMKNLKKDTEVEMYIANIISLIEERTKIRKRMTLEGILKFHMKTCPNKEVGCVCHSLHTEYLKDQDPPEKTWYLWVRAITLDGIARFPKSSRLRILYAYIQREKLQNKFKALFEIMFAHNNKPTIEEEFSIHRYKNLIEEDMIESDMKIAENKGVNVNVIVDFENKFVDFQGVIGAAVDLHLDFWRELQETNPEIQKLQGLGSLITKSVEEVTRHYHALTLINPNHVKMLKVYGNFLHDIINDEAEGQKIMEKAEYNNRSAMVNRQFMDNERIKYGDNANTCIITVSGESNSMGIITNVNNDITRILGFSKSEMMGQNISTIMPKFLMEIHDSFMQNYFESSDAKVIAIERIVFPTNKDGYIVPCTLMAKVLPNLDDGLKLVGFVKEIDETLITNKEEGEPGEEEEAHYIMYDSNTGIIHGVTYGCKTEFGIPSSLVQNADVAMDEFTIDQIFPELPQMNLEDLRSTGTVITTLDTTTLGQDFIIEKDESEVSGYNGGEDKEKRFRRAKVRMSLFQDDQYGDISLKVLKFVEIMEEEEQTPAKHSANVKEGNEQMKYSGMIKVKPGEQNDDYEAGSRLGDQNASEMDSNANNELNEEMRDLKEFKALISEKTVPKSIRYLRNAIILIHVFLLTLTCLGLGFYSSLVNEFDAATTTISSSYSRHDITANINYRLRKLQNLATNLSITTDTTAQAAAAATLQAQEATLIDSLRTVTLDIDDQQDTLQGLGLSAIETDSVLIETLVQTGAKQSTSLFSDAMSQYTSHATSASNAALSSFVSTSVTDSTKADFYYVRRNGLGPLRIKSESNAGVVTQFYINRTGSFDTKFKIIMISLIVLVALSEMVVIPIIFSVHKTATKVLSLFGYIPLNEISALANKCERYVQHYLENHRIQKDFELEGEEENSDRPSKTSRMGDHTYVEVNQNQDMQASMRDQDINASYLVEMSLEDSTRRIHGLRVPETAVMKQINGPVDVRSIENDVKRNMNMDHSSKPFKEDYNASINNQMLLSSPDVKKPGKEEEKKILVQDNEEDADLANDRPQKLLNSKDNTRSKVVMQIGVYGVLLIAYGIMNYLVERASLQSTKSALQHLQLVSQRMPNARFINDFTLEYVSQNGTDVYNYSGVAYDDYRVDYQSRTLTNSNQLKDSIQNGYPAQFDSYVSTFNSYENGNICTSYYATADATTQANCASIAGGLLTKGLTLCLTRIVQISDDLVKEFNSSARDTAAQQIVITDSEFQDTDGLVDMMAPVVDAVKTTFLNSFSDFLSYEWTIARVRFAVFVSLACLTMIFFWVPYLNSLRDKVFRTKGMLNMIPMELIAKNANLRSLFVNSGDILQAVK